MEDCRVVFVTAPPNEVAEKLAKALVGERLAACVNLVPGLRSIYRWKGEVCDEGETLLIIKTQAARLDALMRRVKELHPYEVPEIIALPVVEGHEPYLKWVKEETKEIV